MGKMAVKIAYQNMSNYSDLYFSILTCDLLIRIDLFKGGSIRLIPEVTLPVSVESVDNTAVMLEYLGKSKCQEFICFIGRFFNFLSK